MLTHIRPPRSGLSPVSSTFKGRAVPVRSLGHTRNRQVPRVPSPASGITSGGEASRASSADVTPPSQLLRTHAPDRVPPSASFLSLCGRSWQVVVSPCWDSALPDVISAVCVKVPGPIPRSVPWPTPLASRRSTGQDHNQGHRPRLMPAKLGTPNGPCNATSTGGGFRGGSHSLMFRLPDSLGPQIAPTTAMAMHTQRLHRAARPFTSRNGHGGYPPRTVISLRTRNGKLVRRDFHPQDCGLVGRYPGTATHPGALT
jgi:hypothetical protein